MIKKTLKINGVERILILDKDETLAQVLREHLLLTGCKICLLYTSDAADDIALV